MLLTLLQSIAEIIIPTPQARGGKLAREKTEAQKRLDELEHRWKVQQEEELMMMLSI